MNDQIDVRDVKPTSGNLSGDQNSVHRSSELLEVDLAQFLTHVAVEQLGVEAEPRKNAFQLLRDRNRVGENKDPPGILQNKQSRREIMCFNESRIDFMCLNEQRETEARTFSSK